MSELLARIAERQRPMIGMIALRPLAGSSRYRAEPLTGVVTDALRQAEILRAAGFDMLMLQNLGDLPVARRTSPAQVAWMTRIAVELRHAYAVPIGLNLLENDAVAMMAVASGGELDFVRIKVFVGATVTAAGIESGQAFDAVRARTAWGCDGVAILADVHDRTGVPVATAGLADDIRSAFALGGADGVVLTGRSHRETLDFLTIARDAFPNRAVFAGGGVSADTIAEIFPLCNGAIVSSALRRGGDLFAELEPQRAADFRSALERVREHNANT